MTDVHIVCPSEICNLIIRRASGTVIEFRKVNKWFGPLHVLKDIDLTVEAGNVVVVCGPSGSGKSTLIRCINRLETIQSGDIIVDGRSVCRRSSWTPQACAPKSAWSFNRSISTRI